MSQRTKTMERPSTERIGTRCWLKRIGWFGFLFFLLKGVVWIAVFCGVGTLFAC